ncbi:Gfo/Idh/MocA family protein [Gaoshiqia sp. Z1-71]|uniref:Gfo/Idh/MocA family protein n=1 Tax=Gaoshiqia hydrogeniformans TaxID=3290090 RepID=UPI003BF8289A
MYTRRSFIKKVSQGTAMSALACSPGIAAASNMIFGNESGEKPLIIGIIGAENSHTIGLGKVFNIEKKFPGAELRYVWGETEDFAKAAMQKGNIPNMVKDPKEMLGKIDALIVDHRHAKYHLGAARPFVEAGIPTFIDKPFCYRLSEGKEFLAMAREKGTPVSSFSSVAQSAATFDIREQVQELEDFNNIVSYGPADFSSPYGGIFFYGIHLVEPLMLIFGEDIETVRVTRNGSHGSANLLFTSGLFATLIFKRLSYGWNTYIETKNEIKELKSRVQEPVPAKNYSDMVDMFRTGKEPRSHESILKSVAVLEALEKSGNNGKWVEVKI